MCNARYNFQVEMACHEKRCADCSEYSRDKRWHTVLYYIGAFAMGVCFMKFALVFNGVI
jgi:hypothetical protein